MTPVASITLLYGGRVQRRDWSVEEISENQARAILRARRWPQGVRCPYCSAAEHYETTRGRYRCANPACRRDYWEGTGTIMENTKVKSGRCRTWLLAEALFQAGALQREMDRTLCASRKSSFEMYHKLKNNGGKLL